MDLSQLDAARLAWGGLGVLPPLVVMAYFDYLDRRRPEPRWTLRLVALSGSLSALPLVWIESWLAGLSHEISGMQALLRAWPSLDALYHALGVAAAPEELAKLACVMMLVWKRPEFDEMMDGLVYGARAGLGFSLVENVAFLAQASDTPTYIAMFVLRALMAVPGHAAWGAILGYFVAGARLSGAWRSLCLGVACAIALHGVYDWCLMMGARGVPQSSFAKFLLPCVPIAVIVMSGAWVRRLARRALELDDLAELARHDRLIAQSNNHERSTER